MTAHTAGMVPVSAPGACSRPQPGHRPQTVLPRYENAVLSPYRYGLEVLAPAQAPGGQAPLLASAAPATSAWQSEAACRELPTELFFPVGHGPRAQAQARRAKDICDACRVRPECLGYAMAANMPYGVFGGLAEDERRELRRQSHAGYGAGDRPLEASA